MQFELDFDTKAFNDMLQEMGKTTMRAETTRVAVLNKAIASARNEMKKAISDTYNIKEKQLNGGDGYPSHIRARKVQQGDKNGYLTIRGTKLTLYRFVTSSKIPHIHKGKKMGAIRRFQTPRIEVKRGQSRYMGIKNKPFIASAKGKLKDGSSNYQVFVREGNDIKVARTTSTAEMASNKEVQKRVNSKVGKDIQKRIAYEMKKYTGR